MKSRGRDSAAALAVAVSPVEAVQRPDAPYDLTDEQAAEWWAVVNRLPADWFPRETHPLLSEYCRMVVNCRRAAQLVAAAEAADPFDVKEWASRLDIQEKQGRAMSSLATRLRLTPQSTHDKTKKKGPTQIERPWGGQDTRRT